MFPFCRTKNRMDYLQSEMGPFMTDRYYERGLSNYAANNTTALATRFDLNPDDIARLDEDITTHAFREDYLRQPSPFKDRYYNHQQHFHDENKENYCNPPQSKQVRGHDEIGKLAVAIGNGPLSSEMDHSPLHLRRSTSDAARKVITPPTSSSPPDFDKPSLGRRPLANVGNTAMAKPPVFDAWKAERDGALIEMQNLYEQRIEALKQAETERVARIESEYKTKIEKLQKDMEFILKKQEDLMKLKDDVEHKDSGKYREAYRKEHEARKSDRSKYEEKIRELTDRIEELQKRLKKFNNGYADKDKNSLIRSYEKKIADIQEESNRRIADLIKQFEREKQSALEIMKTKIKSEVSLLVPRIKQQCQEAFGKALNQCQEQAAQRYKDKYNDIIRRLKEEHLAEKRFIHKQAKEQSDQEKIDFQRKLKAKYEMKVLEVKNECEKRIIDRLRNGRRNNVSFVSEMPTISDNSCEDSFLY